MMASATCDPLIRQVIDYIRDEADFNRSWVDGRRSLLSTPNEGYIARRLLLAAQRDAWAGAIETLIADHDVRVTELLEANNREVERRRAAERTALSEAEARERSDRALRERDQGMQVLLDRLRTAGVDCSDLFS